MRILPGTLRKLGTLAYNRAFSVQDFVEYTGNTAAALRFLVQEGLIQKTEDGYYPTSEGWKKIEEAAKRYLRGSPTKRSRERVAKSWDID